MFFCFWVKCNVLKTSDLLNFNNINQPEIKFNWDSFKRKFPKVLFFILYIKYLKAMRDINGDKPTTKSIKYKGSKFSLISCKFYSLPNFLLQKQMVNCIYIAHLLNILPGAEIEIMIKENKTGDKELILFRYKNKFLYGIKVNEKQEIFFPNSLEFMSNYTIIKLSHILPLGASYIVTSPFGMRQSPIFRRRRFFHKGVDLKESSSINNSLIICLAPGKIIYSDYRYDYGYHIIVDHGNGIQTKYCHLSKHFWNIGDQIDTGTILGVMGSSGYSTGPHLHLEFHRNKQYIDPQKGVFVKKKTNSNKIKTQLEIKKKLINEIYKIIKQ